MSHSNAKRPRLATEESAPPLVAEPSSSSSTTGQILHFLISLIGNQNYPSQHSERLACPFCKRYPWHYLTVGGACVQRHGLEDMSALKEHINRVHTMKYGCLVCRKRFTCRDKDLVQVKLDHCEACSARHDYSENDLKDVMARHAAESGQKRKKGKGGDGSFCFVNSASEQEPHLMTPDQEDRWFKLDLRMAGVSGQQTRLKERWDVVYTTLFPEVQPIDIPDPYYKPGYPWNCMPALLSWAQETMQNFHTEAHNDVSAVSGAHASSVAGSEETVQAPAQLHDQRSSHAAPSITIIIPKGPESGYHSWEMNGDEPPSVPPHASTAILLDPWKDIEVQHEETNPPIPDELLRGMNTGLFEIDDVIDWNFEE
ncbi:hypothetical protein B0J13DRAFT_63773 [Dactylonectria estremocensis]|uniref:Uncharacterized protein n=1 Tax=Dactylonectria estremocensis TaxID=1079267 RepID=A0A9P9ENN2_9HYPO|nr:hypothetical protein B0J13DRAFT_63773 [Dactylonectria estremocensis]